MLETTAIIDFLLLRLKWSLHEARMEDEPGFRRAVVPGTVEFAGLRVGCRVRIDLIWKFVR